MPQIGQFNGIAVRINYSDHPPPHLQAFYGSRHAMVEIATGTVLRGGLPPAKHQRLQQWIAQHRKELSQAFNRASQQMAPPWIPYP